MPDALIDIMFMRVCNSLQCVDAFITVGCIRRLPALYFCPIIIPAKAFASIMESQAYTFVCVSVCLFVRLSVTTITNKTWTDLDKILGKVTRGKSKPKFVCSYDR